MPCHHPLQATFSLRKDGKKSISFSNANARAFHKGYKLIGDSNLSLPCGRCMGCRLERSRQWALRCLHESKLNEDNCFVTLTFNPEHLVKMCPGGSLVRRYPQLFMKKLRKKFSDGINYKDKYGKEFFYKRNNVRFFGCGEYGDEFSRPHYHFCLFNCTFPDRKYFKTVNGFKYYTSDILSSLWSMDGNSIGHCSVSDFSFETAAYVARYCTKKIVGKNADDHYQGRLPEFHMYSNRPGIGAGWFKKYARTDLIPHDDVIVRGVRCKPPRYYDTLWEREDPLSFALIKDQRAQYGESKSDDNTHRRLLVKEKCMNARIRLLVRSLESSKEV